MSWRDLTLLLAYLFTTLCNHQACALERQILLGNNAFLNLHQQLIDIPSVTGTENGVGKFLQRYLQEAGFTVEMQTVEGDRENVFAYFGQPRNTSVLLTSHIDTVPPFISYARHGNDVYGRGSNDAKGSVATQIGAVQDLRKDNLLKDGDVALLYVVGEEKGGVGMKAANELDLTWSTVIFGEPTELNLACGHKGGLHFNLTAHGKAGHSGYPEVGRNAIDILAEGIVALRSISLPSSSRFGNTTFNVGQIEGGVAANVIPEYASASVSVRVAVDDIDEIKRIIEHKLLDTSPWLEIEWSSLSRGPVPIDCNVDGFATAIMNYGTDIPSLEGQHKRYLFGPGSILNAHSDHEHVSIDDLFEAVEGYKALLKHALEDV